jgi:hypothetical protein
MKNEEYKAFLFKHRFENDNVFYNNLLIAFNFENLTLNVFLEVNKRFPEEALKYIKHGPKDSPLYKSMYRNAHLKPLSKQE